MKYPGHYTVAKSHSLLIELPFTTLVGIMGFQTQKNNYDQEE